MKKFALAILLISCLSLFSQIWPGDSRKETQAERELKDGKLTITFTAHVPCFAATYPGCPGHQVGWREVYFSSNGIVALQSHEDIKP